MIKPLAKIVLFGCTAIIVTACAATTIITEAVLEALQTCDQPEFIVTTTEEYLPTPPDTGICRARSEVCTLRTAHALALACYPNKPKEYVIRLSPGAVYTVTHNAESDPFGDMATNEELVIRAGNGQGPAVIRYEDPESVASNVFFVGRNASFGLENIEITGAAGTVIENNGELVLTNTSFTSNDGAAIRSAGFITADGVLIERSTYNEEQISVDQPGCAENPCGIIRGLTIRDSASAGINIRSGDPSFPVVFEIGPYGDGSGRQSAISGNARAKLLANGAQLLLNGVRIENNGDVDAVSTGAGASRVEFVSALLSGNTDLLFSAGEGLLEADYHMTNTTVSGNMNVGFANILSSSSATSSMRLNFLTVANNNNVQFSSASSTGILTMGNSIVVGNDEFGCTFTPEAGNPGASNSINLRENIGPAGSDGCDFQINGDPQLGPLQRNPGPRETLTHLPAANSIAIDGVDPTGFACSQEEATDQRGVPRLQGAGCDMGAVELR